MIKADLLYGMAALERHQDGGTHIHIVTAADAKHRWARVKKRFTDLTGLVPHVRVLQRYEYAAQYLLAPKRGKDTDASPFFAPSHPDVQTMLSYRPSRAQVCAWRARSRGPPADECLVADQSAQPANKRRGGALCEVYTNGV